MEVILQEDFPSLGYIGDKVVVRGGYARNYLIPRGIAVEARSRDARLLAHRVSIINAKKAKKKLEAEEARKQVEAVSLSFTLKGSGSGRGFGAVTTRDIEEGLKEKGISVDKRWIKVPESLKAAGEYRISVKLHSEVIARLPVKVIIEAGPKKVESKAKEEVRGAGRSEETETATASKAKEEEI